MKKLSIHQRKAISEISGNIAVAWFVGGIISPFFIGVKEIVDFLYKLLVSLTMFFGFTYFSLFIFHKKNYD